MHVLHIFSSLSERLGGPSQFLKACDRLSGLGVDVHVWSTDVADRGSWFPSVRTRRTRINVPIPRNHSSTIRYFPVAWPSRFKRSPALGEASAKNLEAFDIVHVHGLYLYSSLVGCRAARRLGKPYVIQPHGALDPYILNRHKFRKAAYTMLLERTSLNNASGLIFASKEELALTHRLGLKSPGFVLPLGVDPDDYSDLAPGRFRQRWFPGSQGLQLIIFLGRLCQKKGVDLLIPAFGRLAHQFPNARLVLAGPDDEGYGPTLKRLIAQAGVNDRVILTGMVEGQDKLDLLADADLWVLPSYSENFGIAVVEAMACGLPIVISDKVNISGEVAQAGAGLVTACNIDKLTDSMGLLLREKVIRGRLSIAAKKLVRERYTWQKTAENLLSIYEGILSADRSSAWSAEMAGQ